MSKSVTRTCQLTGVERSTREMIRLVCDPEGVVVPDLAEKLPGRGVWITASKELLLDAEADKKWPSPLARGFKSGPVKVSDIPLSLMIDELLERKCLSQMGLERKKGMLIPGFEKVKKALANGRAKALIIANDAAEDSEQSLLALARHTAKDLPQVRLFNRDQMAQALGRETVVFLAWTGVQSEGRFWLDLQRLSQFRENSVS